MSIIRITHHYDIGNQDVFITRKTGDVNPLHAALYCQFMSEEWFGEGSSLTNLGIAAMLVMYYGFCHAAVTEDCQTIDMYSDREAACSPLYGVLMADTSLHRDGLRESMTNFFA